MKRPHAPEVERPHLRSPRAGRRAVGGTFRDQTRPAVSIELRWTNGSSRSSSLACSQASCCGVTRSTVTLLGCAACRPSSSMPRDLLLGRQQTSDRHFGGTCPRLGMSPMGRYCHYVGRGRDPGRRHCRTPFADLHDAGASKASDRYVPVSVSTSARAVRPQSLPSGRSRNVTSPSALAERLPLQLQQLSDRLPAEEPIQTIRP